MPRQVDKNNKRFEDPALHNQRYVFRDRSDAGKQLARKLSAYARGNALVLAIPAGGVPVGLEIARGLDLPLDLLIVRKIQIPGDTEAGFGAVGPDGEVIFNEALLSRLGLGEEEISGQVVKTKRVMEARNQLFRGGRPFPDLGGKSAILVDDGLASGFTMAEAAGFARRKGTRKIIVAVPTGSEGAVQRLLPLVDELYCLNVRTFFPFAVAEAYENWYDLSDEEVLGFLQKGPSP